MKTSSIPSLTQAFAQFLESSSFARRTRESYTEDLAPWLAEVGQKPATALADIDLRAFLARQESLAPTTYNRRLAVLRSFTQWLRSRGGSQRNFWLVLNGNQRGNEQLGRWMRKRSSPCYARSKTHETARSSGSSMMEVYAAKKHSLSILRTFPGLIARSVFMAKVTAHAKCSSHVLLGSYWISIWQHVAIQRQDRSS